MIGFYDFQCDCGKKLTLWMRNENEWPNHCDKKMERAFVPITLNVKNGTNMDIRARQAAKSC